MDTWIISALAPVVVSIVAWILNKSNRKLAEFERIIKLHQGEISRLSTKLEQMELKIESKDDHLERQRIIINEAFRCKKPSSQCPVLIRQSEYYQQKIYEKSTNNHPLSDGALLQQGALQAEYDPTSAAGAQGELL